MTIFDRIILLLTGLVAIYMIWQLIKKPKGSDASSPSNVYYMISFLVLLVAGLLLVFFGWGALGNKLVSIVAGLIPFGLALGLVARFYPKSLKLYMVILTLGLILIAVTKFVDMGTAGKIIYPVFHAIAGFTIFFIPMFALKAGKVNSKFLFVTVGGTLIGLGGIALAFISLGKQLLFFSPEFVLTILAPLLFLTTLSYAIGLTKGG